MAFVFRGLDRALERPVAIKVLRPELATAVGAERFVREAKRLANLTHPHLVSVHEAGEADGLYYYVMDLIEADTLGQLLARGPLPPRSAVLIAEGLLEALHVVHEGGLVHRDVKPENIFVQGGHPLLADFGIAKSFREESHVLTQAGAFLGTPAFMSPEQAQGQPVGPPSDLYSVGQVLFLCLTGRQWRLGASGDDIEWGAVRHPLRPILVRALDPIPEHRWPDAASFRAALRGARVGGARRGGRYGRTVATAVTAGVAASLIWFVRTGRFDPGEVALSEGSHTARIDGFQIESVAMGRCSDESEAGDQAHFALAVEEGISRTLRGLRLPESQGDAPLLRVTRHPSLIGLADATTVRTIADSLAVDAIMSCSVHRADSRITATLLLASGATGDSLRGREREDDVARFILLGDQISADIAAWFQQTPGAAVGPSRDFDESAIEAYALARKAWGLRTEDPEALNDAMREYRRALAAEPFLALAWAGLAEVYVARSGRGLDPPSVAFDSARVIALRAIELDSMLAGPHAVLGEAIRAYYWDDWPAAETHFLAAIQWDPGYAVARLWYAQLLSAEGRHIDAIQQARTASETAPEVGLSTGLGQILYLAGEADSAVAQLERTVARWPGAWEAQLWLVAARVHAGEREAALTLLEDVQTPEPADPMRAAGYAALEQPARARALLDSSTGILPFWEAVANELLGERETAWEQLNAARLGHDEFLCLVGVLPLLRNLRLDPRFADFASDLPWMMGR